MNTRAYVKKIHKCEFGFNDFTFPQSNFLDPFQSFFVGWLIVGVEFLRVCMYMMSQAFFSYLTKSIEICEK